MVSYFYEYYLQILNTPYANTLNLYCKRTLFAKHCNIQLLESTYQNVSSKNDTKDLHSTKFYKCFDEKRFFDKKFVRNLKKKKKIVNRINYLNCLIFY